MFVLVPYKQNSIFPSGEMSILPSKDFYLAHGSVPKLITLDKMTYFSALKNILKF